MSSREHADTAEMRASCPDERRGVFTKRFGHPLCSLIVFTAGMVALVWTANRVERHCRLARMRPIMSGLLVPDNGRQVPFAGTSLQGEPVDAHDQSGRSVPTGTLHDSWPAFPNSPVVLRAIPPPARVLASDCAWLAAHGAWMRADWATMVRHITLATSLNPDNLHYWLRGNRMITYDSVNVSSASQLAGNNPVETPDSGQEEPPRRVAKAQARIGEKLLTTALQYHPGSIPLRIELGLLYLHPLNQPERAAGIFHDLAQHPDAPYFCARIYGEILIHLGKLDDAYEWYSQLFPSLPSLDTDPTACKPAVKARIEQLELLLQAR